MKFIKCQNCHHFNPINSEYQIFCDNCGKKLDQNFKAWQQKNPNKNFEAFKEIIGTEKVIIKKRNKKTTLRTWLQIIFLIIFISLGYYFGEQQSKKVYRFFHDFAFPISELLEKDWERQYSKDKQVSFESPFLLKKIQIEEQLPEKIKDLILNMENYASEESTIFNTAFSVIEYYESVKVLNIKNGSEGAVVQMVQKMNGTDLYYSNKETFINQYPAIIKTGNFKSDGNIVYFKTVSVLKTTLQEYNSLLFGLVKMKTTNCFRTE